MAIFLVGIDDTDAINDRGTGYRARQLGALLDGLPGVRVHSIARHQLLVDPRIPYTSHNSSASLWVEAPADLHAALVSTSQAYLLQASAAAADPGLCVAHYAAVKDSVVAFGKLAQCEVTTMDGAMSIAERAGIHLEGLAGTRGGLIGALAAVGLRKEGNSGRMLWLPGLRELEGVVTVDALCAATGIERVETISGETRDPGDRIELGDWARPILRYGRIVLLVEGKSTYDGEANDSEFKVVGKETIKRLSE